MLAKAIEQPNWFIVIPPIGIGEDLWSTHIWQPGKPPAVLLRVKVETDVAVRAWTATGKERLDCEPRL
ncbi:MAG: hypothetical protein DME71_03655 [Verrucomicrobia bacterium]|nr:MAG: hypothetical protein DME92_04520 [Verrucomicrobiota bacterium]PYJ91131.1 MAG: hypothetical protein DME71_03655 [Verrucomicrobiota bacterium]